MKLVFSKVRSIPRVPLNERFRILVMDSLFITICVLVIATFVRAFMPGPDAWETLSAIDAQSRNSIEKNKS
jgi:hypothetical protein